MDRLVTAESKQELSELFESLRACLEQVDENVRRRILELLDPAEQDDLQAARAWLKLNSIIMCTSSTVTFLKTRLQDTYKTRQGIVIFVLLAAIARAECLWFKVRHWKPIFSNFHLLVSVEICTGMHACCGLTWSSACFTNSPRKKKPLTALSADGC